MTHRRSLILGVLIAALVLIGVPAYWYWGAQQIEGAIEQWAAKYREEGYEIAYGRPDVSGFPFSFDVQLAAPAMTSPRGWRWTGDEITGRARLWAPRTLRLDLPTRQIVTSDLGGIEQKVEIEAAFASGVVRLGGGGRVRAAELLLGGLVVIPQTQTPIRIESVFAELGERPARKIVGGTRKDTLQLNGEILDIRLPAVGGVTPFGSTIERIGFETLVIGEITAGRPVEVLTRWRDRGGYAEILSLAFKWGALEIDADGTATVDEALRPQGSLSARIRGLKPTIDFLEAEETIRSGTAFAIRLAARGLSATGGEVELPVILKNGLFYLGPAPLFRVDPVL